MSRKYWQKISLYVFSSDKKFFSQNFWCMVCCGNCRQRGPIVSHFVFPFICYGHLDYFHFGLLKMLLWMFVCKFLCEYIFGYLEHVPRHVIAGLYSNSVFNIMWNCKQFQSGFAPSTPFKQILSRSSVISMLLNPKVTCQSS